MGYVFLLIGGLSMRRSQFSLVRPDSLRKALLMILLIGAVGTTLALDTGNLKMYCWLGEGTGGLFGHVEGNSKFDDFFLNAVKIKDTKIDLRPPKQKILNEIEDADVIYANTHAGCTEEGPSRMIIKTGDAEGPANEITAQEIKDLYQGASHLPTLIIITGCKTLAECGDNALKINEAFQIYPNTKGRTYIGFDKAVTGGCGDSFFRIFFAQWTSTPYPTLAEARDRTTAFFSKELPEGQKFLDPGAWILPGCPPKKIGEMMSIIGDESLTFDKLAGA
jgi:hypothetical protein